MKLVVTTTYNTLYKYNLNPAGFGLDSETFGNTLISISSDGGLYQNKSVTKQLSQQGLLDTSPSSVLDFCLLSHRGETTDEVSIMIGNSDNFPNEIAESWRTSSMIRREKKEDSDHPYWWHSSKIANYITDKACETPLEGMVILEEDDNNNRLFGWTSPTNPETYISEHMYSTGKGKPKKKIVRVSVKPQSVFLMAPGLVRFRIL
jgi:hypothetical protein